MRKIYTMLFTLIVLLSMAMSAEALGSKTFERHNGGSAYADWTEVNGDITTSKYLSVTEQMPGLMFIWISTPGGQIIGPGNRDICLQRMTFSA